MKKLHAKQLAKRTATAQVMAFEACKEKHGKDVAQAACEVLDVINRHSFGSWGRSLTIVKAVSEMLSFIVNKLSDDTGAGKTN